MRIRRLLGGLLALTLLAPSVAKAQTAKVVTGSSAMADGAVSPIEVTLGALPQITPEVAAQHPTAPPIGTGVSAAIYAQRKQAANLQSQFATTGSSASAAPKVSGSGPAQTPFATGFAALKFPCGGKLVPPDQGLAVGRSYVVEMVNACVAVYDKAGNLQAGFPKSLNTFFGLGAAAFTYDPRAIYDWVNNRFIAIATRSGGSIKPQILVAVSQTDNPLGGWHIYNLKGAAGTLVGELSDFPELGQDRKAVYVSFNRFDASQNFVDARIMILPKGVMYSGGVLTYAYWYNFTLGGLTLDTIQPANEFSPSDHPRAEFFLESLNINFGGGQCSSGCKGLVVWAISNPLVGNGVISGFVIGTANTYYFPPEASQPSCTNCIDTDDVRITGGVTYHAGSLFGSLNTAASGAGPHVLWFEVKPVLNDNNGVCSNNACPQIVGASIANEGCFFCGSSGNWYYGTLQPDLENNVTMVFNYSDSTYAPSVAYVSRRATMPQNAMHDAGIFLFNPMADYALEPMRWGDYSATAPDLTTASSQVWFAGEFSNALGVWRTAIGHNSFNLVTNP